jgi:hypothetical protein
MTAAFAWWSEMGKPQKNLSISGHPTETVINRRSSKCPLKERNKAGRGRNDKWKTRKAAGHNDTKLKQSMCSVYS